MLIKNFITISVFFLTFVSINLFASDSCKGMFREKDEKEQSKLKLTIPKSQKEWEEQRITEKNNTSHSKPVQQDNSSFGVLPNDTLLYIFSLLKVEDLGRTSQIYSRWHEVCGITRLWENVGLENHRDYFTVIDLKEKPKEKVIHHCLSVRLNILDTKEETRVSKKFKEKYCLISFTPYFKAFLPSAVKNEDIIYNAKVMVSLKLGKIQRLKDSVAKEMGLFS